MSPDQLRGRVAEQVDHRGEGIANEAGALEHRVQSGTVGLTHHLRLPGEAVDDVQAVRPHDYDLLEPVAVHVAGGAGMAAQAACAAVSTVAVRRPDDRAAAKLAAAHGSEHIQPGSRPEVANPPIGQAAEVPDRHAPVDIGEAGVPAHLAGCRYSGQAGVARRRLAGKQDLQIAVQLQIGGDDAPMERGVVGLTVAGHAPAHLRLLVRKARRCQTDHLLRPGLHHHLDATIPVQIGDHRRAGRREALPHPQQQLAPDSFNLHRFGGAAAAQLNQRLHLRIAVALCHRSRFESSARWSVHRPQLAGAARGQREGEKHLRRTLWRHREEVQNPVGVRVSGRHRAPAVGRAGVDVRRQRSELARAVAPVGQPPANQQLVAGQRPDLERRVGGQCFPSHL